MSAKLRSAVICLLVGGALVGAIVLYISSRPSMPPEKLDRAGRSPLFYAAADGDAAEVTRLIKAGANVNLKDSNGDTPLHFAAQENKAAVAKLLLEAGANVEAKERDGNTPLMRAVLSSRGEGDVIRLLRSWKADPYAKNNHGISPIELARSVANFDIAQFFNDLPK